MTYDEQVQVVARRCAAVQGAGGVFAFYYDNADRWGAEAAGRIGGGPTIRLAAASLFARLYGKRPDEYAREHGDDELLRATEGLEEEGAEYD